MILLALGAAAVVAGHLGRAAAAAFLGAAEATALAAAAHASGAAALAAAPFAAGEPVGRARLVPLALAVAGVLVAGPAGWPAAGLVAGLAAAAWLHRRLAGAAAARLAAAEAAAAAARAEIERDRAAVEVDRQDRARRLRALTDRYETVRTIGSSLRFIETLKHVAEGSVRLLGVAPEVWIEPGDGVIPGYYRVVGAAPAPAPPAHVPEWRAARAGRPARRREGEATAHWVGLRARGEVIGVLAVRTTAPDEAVQVLADQAAMAFEKVRLYARVLRESETDLLTGLPHHARFKGLLETEVERAGRAGRSFSVAMIDIDRFKETNDTHGHRAGDAVLVAVARTIRGAARDVDVVARYGGEEFAAILPETPLEGAHLFAERLRRRIEAARIPVKRAEGGETLLGVTVSIGAAAFPAHGRTADRVLAAADAALYEAKRAGRNRVVLGGGRP